ncbi:RES family NAD+ phosphorylase [Serratia marcescens]|uniref:RES family NAD+ phosphorylase n=1 Tax=Serratia marcescens TaxID=615 RepID=UPI0018D9F5E9|nr:RES family NAD+ phosphorylase [Serratia marcescens]
MPSCCSECFHDIEIVEFIVKDHLNGRCGHCKKENAFTINPEALSHFFEPFLGLVTEKEDGRLLSEVLNDLFNIFSSKVKSNCRLLSEILGGDYGQKKYELKQDFQEHISAWETFKEELKHQNRFFPKNTLYSSLFDTREANIDGDLFQIIEQLRVEYDEGEVFYRARINDGPLLKVDMGMPPKEKATAGRANPVGIPYLYLADHEKTCVAEVRPNNTSTIYIANFTSNKKLSIVDLTEPRKRFSVCSFDEGRFTTIIGIIKLLETLSNELSKPVRPESSSIDYIPTQFLCEFLKGFSNCDGIAFESSFGKGKNFVFFDDAGFDIEDPVPHKIISIEHNFLPKQ